MKKISTVFVAFVISVSGALAPVFAAPTVEQVQQWVQDQPQTPNPRIQAAQQAFELASMNYAMHAMAQQLNDIEVQIDQILSMVDLIPSLQKSFQTVLPPSAFENITNEEELQSKLEDLSQADPQLENKLMNAYRQNQYIQKLIPLFWANQDQYLVDEVDQDTFDMLVVMFVNMVVSMQEMMQQPAE